MAESKPTFPYSSLRQQTEAATLGMWVMLATEVLMFGVLFLGYTVYRYWYPQAFANASAQLDLSLASVNTGVLLTSSLTMALAAAAVHHDRRRAAGWLAATALLGSIFLVIKGYAWHSEYQQQLVPLRWLTPDYSHIGGDAAQMFFNLYFLMTGLHAVHLLIGIGLVIPMGIYVLKSNRINTPLRRVKVLGLYWHFIDVIWVFLFPLLYLL